MLKLYLDSYRGSDYEIRFIFFPLQSTQRSYTEGCLLEEHKQIHWNKQGV